MRPGLALVRWTLAGIGAGIVLAFVLSSLAGWRTYTVMSGSMSPAIETGAVIVDRPTAPRAIEVGDVVTFPSPENRARLVTHRVVSRAVRGARVDFVTQGDANTGVERWSVAGGGQIGHVMAAIPRAGYALVWLRVPLHTLLLLLLPALALGLWELVRIWRPVGATADAPR